MGLFVKKSNWFISTKKTSYTQRYIHRSILRNPYTSTKKSNCFLCIGVLLQQWCLSDHRKSYPPNGIPTAKNQTPDDFLFQAYGSLVVGKNLHTFWWITYWLTQQFNGIQWGTVDSLAQLKPRPWWGLPVLCQHGQFRSRFAEGQAEGQHLESSFKNGTPENVWFVWK